MYLEVTRGTSKYLDVPKSTQSTHSDQVKSKPPLTFELYHQEIDAAVAAFVKVGRQLGVVS